MYKPPYIGITGFTSAAEVKVLASVMPANATHQLMCGVLASKRTLGGEVPSRFPKRYPKLEKIAEIFSSDSRMLNLIHYSSPSQGMTLAHELVEVRAEYGGLCCDGVQVNIAWPSPKYLAIYRGMAEHLISTTFAPEPISEVIVLQVGQHALEEYGYDPVAVAGRLKDYDGIVNYVLVDPSSGKGEPFMPSLAEFAEILAMLMPKSMGLAIAGGLSALSVDRILGYMPGLKRQQLSLDAEGRLRTITDELDLVAAKSYLLRAHSALQQVPA